MDSLLENPRTITSEDVKTICQKNETKAIYRFYLQKDSLNTEWTTIHTGQSASQSASSSFHDEKFDPTPFEQPAAVLHPYDIGEALGWYTLYNDEYRPPEWTLSWYEHIWELAGKATIVATEGSNKIVIKKLVTQREPTHIKGPCYDQYKLNDKLGYSTSYYGRLWLENKTLGPNFAVYTETETKLDSDFYNVHIYNAIAYVFDDEKEPDYQKIIGWEHAITVNNTVLYLYKQLLSNIYHFANNRGFNTVVMSFVGCDNFALLFPRGNKEFQKIWVAAFQSVNKFNVKTLFMGAQSPNITAAWNMLKEQYQDIGVYPDCLKKNNLELNKTLFVNEWNPHSLLGNGNKGDFSLDGHIGQCTAFHLLGWGVSNPQLLNNFFDCPKVERNLRNETAK